ncbi:unnamed protein product [Spodoptera exigua]|nr:unnamed protein product [Spodoptera exigua]
MSRLVIFLFSFCIFCGVRSASGDYDLNILHYNDFHARFVETNRFGGSCNQNDVCIGGFARLATLVRQRLVEEPDSLLLNAGDSFQGTLWYNILRWNVTQDFMNMLPHDAHALGNHEFDNGIEGLVPYLKHLNSKVVTANIIDDLEPTMQGLYEKSIIVTRKNRRIGIIGVLIATTDTLASTGKLKFTDEIEAVREEAEKLNAQGVDIIVVLSHCGLDIDREIALHGGPHIDIIVGGHSHTLLFNGEAPENSAFIPLGPYPEVVDQENRKVLIVQAAAHTQYLGEIKLTFDDNGHLKHWTGDPHYIGNEIEQAQDVLDKIEKYLPLIQEKASEEIGSALVELSADCTCSECNLGNLMCDAFLHATLPKAGPNQWNYAHFCVNNRGVIRAAINRGGLRVTFNGSLPINSRVVDVQVRCIECDVPRYEPLKLDQYYKVVSQSFMANGGDGYSMISENRKNIEVLGVDYDVLSSYISQQSPVFAENEGRLTFNNFCQQQ